MDSKTFPIAGPVLLTVKPFEDERGYFYESFNHKWFRENVADVVFVQDNQSMSRNTGTIRGLHYQSAPFAQGKLMRCLAGAIFDVAVDIRRESPTFGQWVAVTLTAAGAEQFWIPEGFAHGFCTLEPDTTVHYKVTSYYSREHDKGIAFDDTDIGVAWPCDITRATLSAKDRTQPRLAQLD